MDRWYKLPQKTKINAYKQVAENTGLSAFAVEKDWWVVQSLAIVFEMEVKEFLIFKGGTSLSKGWGLIERFSEDVDLAIDRSFFGYDGELTKKLRTKLRKDASSYISDEFFSTVQNKFKEKGLTDVQFKIVEPLSSDQDPRIIEIHYPNIIDAPGYLKPRVQI